MKLCELSVLMGAKETKIEKDLEKILEKAGLSERNIKSVESREVEEELRLNDYNIVIADLPEDFQENPDTIYLIPFGYSPLNDQYLSEMLKFEKNLYKTIEEKLKNNGH